MMRRHFAMPAAALLLSSLLLAAPAPAPTNANWPEFRGPTGQGLVEKVDLPLEWGPTKNVAWKQKVPGSGWSSPSIVDGKIFLTSAVPVANSKELSLTALCL